LRSSIIRKGVKALGCGLARFFLAPRSRGGDIHKPEEVVN